MLYSRESFLHYSFIIHMYTQKLYYCKSFLQQDFYTVVITANIIRSIIIVVTIVIILQLLIIFIHDIMAAEEL